MTGGARPRTILDEFDRACATRPDGAALEIPATGARLTYAEIDAMANAFAAEILPRVRPDAVVALALPRTDPWLFAGMLGAMRAGAAYAAIDPAFPARQAAEILRDAEAVAIACDRGRGMRRSSRSRTAAADRRGSTAGPSPRAPENHARRPILRRWAT